MASNKLLPGGNGKYFLVAEELLGQHPDSHCSLSKLCSSSLSTSSAPSVISCPKQSYRRSTRDRGTNVKDSWFKIIVTFNNNLKGVDDSYIF